MDLGEGEKYTTNVEQSASTIPVKNDLPEKSIPVSLYIPPHKRKLITTDPVKFAPRQSDLEYSDYSELLHSINELPTDDLISWTNTLLDNNASVCLEAITDLKKNISAYEEQTLESSNGLPQEALNIEQTSFKNTEEKNEPLFESFVDIDDEPESESFQMSNTSVKRKKSDIVDIQSPFATGDNFENLFALNIKADVESLPVLKNYDETKNSSISVSDGMRKVKNIVEKCNETNNLSISTSNSTRNLSDNVEEEKNDDLITKKILDLANAHVNVTFKTMLSELYIKKYSEHIPSSILLYTVLQDINFVVSINNESSKTEDVTSTNKEGFGEHETSFQVVDIEPKLLTSEDISGRFWVKIYNCKSITEIWGKIMNITNLQKLDELSREMKKFYDSENLVAASVKEGGFYVVFKDHFWHRVKCLKCNESTAVVLFIDRGDESTFSLKDIFKLHGDFSLLPAQAIKMSLSDLEDFSDCDEAFTILKDKLYGSTVNATMLLYCYENNCCNVKLYFNLYEENINIADLVIEQLFKTFLNPKCSIQTEEMIHVHLSINERRIFVQLIKSKSYAYFIKLLRNVVTKYLDNENSRHELQLNENKMYLIKSPNTKIWYRAKILKFKNEGEVEVLLIDTGKKVSIKQGHFFLLEKYSSILTKYPQQAIEVQVHELSNFYEHETLEHFRKLIKSTDTFFASFITKTLENNNIPIIRLFKKESDNSLTPINDKLLLNQESRITSVISLQKSESLNQKSQIKSTIVVPLKKSETPDDDITHELQKISKMRELLRSALSLTSISRVLVPPQIPEDYCDVHVTLADNPSKFVIQLLPNKFGELKKLDCELSDACNFYRGPQYTVESVKIGQLYAAKFDEYDYKWYRVYILQVINDTKSARVYYSDYGYYKEVKIENIVPLGTHFHQLPYQAVWAELYGIKPIFKRWTLDDASRFKDLTQNKDFACIIKSKKTFEPKSHQALMPITVETVYSLELVDTSTAEDIYIADVLVDEKRALKSS